MRRCSLIFFCTIFSWHMYEIVLFWKRRMFYTWSPIAGVQKGLF